MNIYEKLAIIQQELKAPKDQYNSFGKYSYRSCEDILEAVKPLLNKTKTVLIMSDRIAEVGARTYLAATVKLIDTESERGESVENTAFAREDEDKKGFDAMQLTGATSSYARKYALNGLFAIDDNKDADYTNNGTEQKKQADKPQKKEAKGLTYEQAVQLTTPKGKAFGDCTDDELKMIVEKCKNPTWKEGAKLILKEREHRSLEAYAEELANSDGKLPWEE